MKKNKLKKRTRAKVNLQVLMVNVMVDFVMGKASKIKFEKVMKLATSTECYKNVNNRVNQNLRSK